MSLRSIITFRLWPVDYLQYILRHGDKCMINELNVISTKLAYNIIVPAGKYYRSLKNTHSIHILQKMFNFSTRWSLIYFTSNTMLHFSLVTRKYNFT